MTLTIKHLQKAYKKMLQPPKHDTFLCKQCNKPNFYTGWECTKLIDGLNYFVCWTCAASGYKK